MVDRAVYEADLRRKTHRFVRSNPRWREVPAAQCGAVETDFDPSKLAATAYEPISLATVILCFAMIRLGIPGEGDTGVPGFRWG